MSISAVIKEAYPRSKKHIRDAFDQEKTVLDRLGITDPKVLPLFLAQCAVESGWFTTLEENLNYKAATLRRVWPRHFTALEAKRYAMRPEQIANKAYGGRMGNDKPGDGWRYRGGGIGMITGKENHTRTGKRIGVDLRSHPELLRKDAGIALRAFAMYFVHHKGHKRLTALQHAHLGSVVGVSRTVNGGLHGLEHRKKATKHFRTILGGRSLPVLRFKSHGREVFFAQDRLVAHGFGHMMGGNPVDGRFGQGTQTAVESFQHLKGLNDDGIIGPATWEALERKPKKPKEKS